MPVEVILRDDVPNLGRIGEVVRVKPGFARNYLLPRGLAIEANSKNLRVLEHQRRVIAAKADRDHKTAADQAKRVEGLELRVQARAGEEGRLFGSVTNIDIVEALKSQGVEIERSMIRMSAGPLKQIGDYPLTVALHTDVVAHINVSVRGDTAIG